MTWGHSRSKNKYGAVKVTEGGRTFDSGFEREFYVQYLRPLELAGEIRDLMHHVRVDLFFGVISLETDFQAFDVKLGETVWWEVKGFEGETWSMKKRIWKIMGPGRLRIVKGTKYRWKLTDEIVPRGLSCLKCGDDILKQVRSK